VDFLELVRTQGLTVAVLIVGIVVLWQTWRADTKEAAEQRERNIAALEQLSGKIEESKKETAALTKSLGDFFLKHFP